MTFYIILFFFIVAVICTVVIIIATPVKYIFYYKSGKNAYMKDNIPAAKKWFGRSIEGNPDYYDGRFMLASCCFRLKEYDEALSMFKQIIKDFGEDYNTLFNTGITLHMKKQYNDALKYYAKAAKLNNEDPDTYFREGVTYFELKDYSKAREVLTSAKLLAPERNDIDFYINRCKDETADYNNSLVAEEILGEYLRLSLFEDKEEDFYLVLAYAYAKNGYIDQAIDECKKHYTMDSSNSKLYTLMGLLELVTENYKRAGEHLLTAVSLNPRDIQNYNLLSYAFLNLKNYEEYEKYKNRYNQLLSEHVIQVN